MFHVCVPTGGFLPEAARGTVRSGLMASWDWYRTLAGVAKADVNDSRAERAHLPPVDSLDLWSAGFDTRVMIDTRTQRGRRKFVCACRDTRSGLGRAVRSRGA